MLTIDELALRVPGLSEAEGHQLANDITERLSAAWPTGIADRQIGQLAVRLTAPPNASPAQLAEAIAKQIMTQIRAATQ